MKTNRHSHFKGSGVLASIAVLVGCVLLALPADPTAAQQQRSCNPAPKLRVVNDQSKQPAGINFKVDDCAEAKGTVRIGITAPTNCPPVFPETDYVLAPGNVIYLPFTTPTCEGRYDVTAKVTLSEAAGVGTYTRTLRATFNINEK